MTDQTLTTIPVNKIIPNPRQPRQEFGEANLAELADSIAQHGVIQPLVVTVGGEDTYILIAGERRWRAAKLAGITELPVVIREASDLDRLELALIENIHRVDLSAIEKALAYQQLTDEFGLTHDQVAEKVGQHRSTITNTLRLLKLPGRVQDALRTGQITERQASSLLQLYELPEALRKAAGEGSYPDIMPATIEARALAGASSDATRADISRMIDAYGKSIPWNADKDVFAVPTGKPALCGECPAKLVRGVDTCGDPNCFAIRLRAYQAQRLIPPEPAPAPAPVAPTTPAERFEAARTALAPKPAPEAQPPDDDENPDPDEPTAEEPPASPAVNNSPAPIAEPAPPLSWEASTIALTVTFMPEDGDPRGRPCIVGLRANNGMPVMRMLRESDVQLAGALAALLDEQRAKFSQ